MRKFLISFALTTSLACTSAFAAGSHSGGHGHSNSDGHHDVMPVGKPGKAENASRTIEVVMKETPDGGMLFEPELIEVKKDETIVFSVLNGGELEHEFILDHHDAMMEHKVLMEKFPEMEHDDPNAIRLEPGETGEILWHFVNAGTFEFGCLIPGHYESGMKGSLKVSGN